MYTAYYPEEIREKIEHVNRPYAHEIEQLDEVIDALFVYATDTDDEELLGFVHYQIAKKEFLAGHIAEYRQHLVDAIRLLQKGAEKETLAGCYNLIAVDNVNRGNYDLAINHFLTARSLLVDYTELPILGLIDCNTADLYGILGDIKSALYYSQRGMDFLKPLIRNGENYLIYLVALSIHGWFAMDGGNMLSARSVYDRLWELKMDVAIPQENLVSIGVLSFEARYAHVMKEEAEVRTCLDKIRELVDHSRFISGVTDDLCRLTRYLIPEGYLDDAKHILLRLDKAAEESGLLNLRSMVTRLHIEYAKKTHDNALLEEKLELFYQLEQAVNAEKSDSYTFSIELSALQNADEKTRLFTLEEDVRSRRQLDFDSVTFLPSRRQFNHRAVEIFRQAKRNERHFAVAIIDIDDFNTLRANRSRATIDKIMRAIADHLREMVTDKILCYRYGPERFLMVYDNMSNHEIYARATTLRDAVAKTKITSVVTQTEVSITVSQGICNAVPSSRLRMWDFLAEADSSLRNLHKNNTPHEIAFYSHRR